MTHRMGPSQVSGGIRPWPGDKAGREPKAAGQGGMMRKDVFRA